MNAQPTTRSLPPAAHDGERGEALEYDTTVYDRRFMNCFQRQTLVFLERAGLPARLLLADALISTDDAFRQIVDGGVRKHAFESDFMGRDALAGIGASYACVTTAAFEEAESLLRDRLSRQTPETPAFVCLLGDAFFLPHSLEFRQVHLQHALSVQEAGDGKDQTWTIVDDDETGSLKRYRYPRETLAAFFDNGRYRMLKRFAWNRPERAGVLGMQRDAHARFLKAVRSHRDSYRLLDRLAEILGRTSASRHVLLRSVREAIDLLAGSRAALRAYLDSIDGDARTEEAARRALQFSETGHAVKNMLMKAELTGRINLDGAVERCARMKLLDTELIASLRHSASAR